MRQIILLLSLLLFILSGCDNSNQTTNAAPEKPAGGSAKTAQGLFNQALQPQLLELPNEALPYWRSDSLEKPALVLFSFDPLLRHIDATLQEKAKNLALNGTPEMLLQHGSLNTAEPLIMPIQTVTAALDAGLFSKIYWIFPTSEAPESIQPPLFRKQMLESQLLSKEEAAAIEYNDGVFSGTLRGIPFEARHPERLNDIPEPIVLHFDLGYFRGLYVDEQSTPIYSLLKDTARGLRSQNWRPKAVTISHSTIEGEISLELRFVTITLAELISDPELLDAELPEEWRLRSETLLAGEANTEEKKVELAQQLVQIAPESAPAQYDLFRALFKSFQLEPSLNALARLVELDPGYGIVYAQMAQVSIQAGNAVKGLELLDKAITLFPENPFQRLQKAHILSVFGEHDEANKILDQLPKNWSPIYHEKIPAVIEKIRNLKAEDKELTNQQPTN